MIGCDNGIEAKLEDGFIGAYRMYTGSWGVALYIGGAVMEYGREALANAHPLSP